MLNPIADANDFNPLPAGDEEEEEPGLDSVSYGRSLEGVKEGDLRGHQLFDEARLFVDIVGLGSSRRT